MYRSLVIFFIIILCFIVPQLLWSNTTSSKVTLLYFNDGHQISPVVDKEGERGGVGRLKAIIDSEKIIDARPLVLFGGDLAGGTLFGGVFKGYPVVEAFNKLPVNFACFGQHDFDFGYDHAMTLVSESHFQWLSTNLRYFDGHKWKVPSGAKPYAVIERNGFKIGLMGLTGAMKTSTREGLVREEDLVKTGVSCASVLKKIDCDFIVAITQTDLDTNRELVLKARYIDLVLTEERYENESAIHYVGNIPIASPCGNLGSVIKVEVGNKVKIGGEPAIGCKLSVIPVTSSIQGNSELVTLERRYEKLLNHRLSAVAGRVSGNSDLHESRVTESASGNLVTDAFRHYYKCDLAFMQGGGIRAPLSSGTFSAKDALSLLPFCNKVVLINVSGAEIKRALEHGLISRKELVGNFLQISGGSYHFDDSLPQGSKLISVTVAGKHLEAEKLYSVALPNYLYGGGGGFDFSSGKKIEITADNLVDSDLLFKYVKHNRNIIVNPERRIVNKYTSEQN